MSVYAIAILLTINFVMNTRYESTPGHPIVFGSLLQAVRVAPDAPLKASWVAKAQLECRRRSLSEHFVSSTRAHEAKKHQIPLYVKDLLHAHCSCLTREIPKP